MIGSMMNYQLTLTSIMQHGKQINPNKEVVSITSDHDEHRCTLGDIFDRSAQVANLLKSNNFQKGDRIATLAWNDFRHMELYYGLGCSGAVCHTINPRLHPDQVNFIINDASDKIVFLDVMFIDLIKAIEAELPTVEQFIVLTSDVSVVEHLGEKWTTYEDAISVYSTEFDWPELNENDPCQLCYTSGTTGNPKGVQYSHRALVLHTMAAIVPDAFSIGKNDCILPVVPMFHVNAWGIPYMAAMAGCKLVFAGSKVADPEVLARLIKQEGVTLAAGVPTVWNLLAQHLQKNNISLPSLKKLVVGGTAMPRHLYSYFQDEQNMAIIHAWGMTEMSPLGTINHIQAKEIQEWDEDALFEQKLKQGVPVYGIELKLMNDDGDEVPWDGETSGNLLVRGPWVVEKYFNRPDVSNENGWFDTGDISIIDKHGYMKITDRSKDVIKSGGEWISSVDIENAMMSHPEVLLAAVIGVEHPRWDERPLLIIQNHGDTSLTHEEVATFLKGKIAKWWMPDAVEYIDNIPMTATGKMHKLKLRDAFDGYTF
jgi:fatty-acyl-CoA synthase